MATRLSQSEFILITSKIMEKMQDIQNENDPAKEMIEGSNERKIALFVDLCRVYLSRQGILFLMMTLPEIEMHRHKVLQQILYCDQIGNKNADYKEISNALKDLLIYINLGHSCEELLEELDKD